MKKIVYGITKIFSILIFSKCKNDRQEENPSNKNEVDCAKNDNSFYSDRNGYINLDITKVYIDSPYRRLDSTEGAADFEKRIKRYDPHNKLAFVRDSTTFANRFISTGIFSNSASFPLFIADMYSAMQTALGIVDRSEYDAYGNETINGIRIYPAIATNTTNGTRVLYLIFLGEETVTSNLGKLVTKTMLKNKYYSVREGKFGEIIPKDTAQANADILSFQNFWHTEFPSSDPTPSPTPVNNPNVNRSFASSIYRYYQLLNGSNLNIFPGLTDATYKYGIIFYPCIENNKLIFVNKGFEEDENGTKITFETKHFYDNMDVCPEKCPSNKIQ